MLWRVGIWCSQVSNGGPHSHTSAYVRQKNFSQIGVFHNEPKAIACSNVLLFCANHPMGSAGMLHQKQNSHTPSTLLASIGAKAIDFCMWLGCMAVRVFGRICTWSDMRPNWRPLKCACRTTGWIDNGWSSTRCFPQSIVIDSGASKSDVFSVPFTSISVNALLDDIQHSFVCLLPSPSRFSIFFSN